MYYIFSYFDSYKRDGMSPVVRSTSRSDWIRLSQSQCYYWKSDSGGYVLSYTFKFDVEEQYEFAYCYPYTYSRLQNHLSNLPSSTVHQKVLTKTLQKRSMDLLTIGSGERTIVGMYIIYADYRRWIFFLVVMKSFCY